MAADDAQLLALKLKLLGTGKSSKMWYTLGGATSKFGWQLDIDRFSAEWQVDASTLFIVSFHAYEDGEKTHIEYSVFKP